MEGGSLEPGSLWPRVVARRARALQSGALQPIPTRSRVVEDGGMRFRVRVAEGLARKAAARPAPGAARRDPFLPYEQDLFVADLSPTHVCLLNKWSVVDHHLLVVTRAFEEQEALLGRADLGALARCLAELDGLGFYNSGARAGASQRHRHLQLVPVPLGAGPERAPLEPLLAGAGDDPGRAPGLPFRHALLRLPALPAAADAAGGLLHERYRTLLGALALGDPPRPYNLLVTREWMLLVPRAREHARGISVNALGFAGALFVRSEAELDALLRAGPLTLLREVALPVATPP